MGQIYCQVTIPHRSLLPADNAQNTFCFTGVDNVEDQATVALAKLNTFYSDVSGTATNPVGEYWSGELNPAGATVKIYDLDDPEPRVPILEESLGLGTITPGSSSNLPAEVALCLSYGGEPQSGVVAARRRGRIYLGPLNQLAGSGSGGTTSRPATIFQTDLREAAEELSNGPVGTQWCVWSRVNNAFYIITQGWIDNAWDTQRRRGAPATSRLAWEGGLG